MGNIYETGYDQTRVNQDCEYWTKIYLMTERDGVSFEFVYSLTFTTLFPVVGLGVLDMTRKQLYEAVKESVTVDGCPTLLMKAEKYGEEFRERIVAPKNMTVEQWIDSMVVEQKIISCNYEVSRRRDVM